MSFIFTWEWNQETFFVFQLQSRKAPVSKSEKKLVASFKHLRRSQSLLISKTSSDSCKAVACFATINLVSKPEVIYEGTRTLTTYILRKPKNWLTIQRPKVGQSFWIKKVPPLLLSHFSLVNSICLFKILPKEDSSVQPDSSTQISPVDFWALLVL